MQGAAPLASPALDRLRHLQNLPRRYPAGGAVVLVACLPCRCGSQRGACPLCHLLTLPLVFFPAPYPPNPLPRWGRGGYKFISPGASPPAPPGLNPWFAAKTEERCSLRAVPVAKERGDRGRGTSAFEMVLSPGAGRTSAARVQLPLPPPIKNSGKVLGGLGASFKKPPTHLCPRRL